MIYPFFPFKLEIDRGCGGRFSSPYEGTVEINESACDLLKLCNGDRSLDEIVTVLAEHYDSDAAEITEHVQEHIHLQEQKGVLWTRREKMRWFDAPPPESIFWEITAECNLRCRHCNVSADRKLIGELSYQACLGLIQEWSQMGVREITFSGGEPLLHENFLQLVHAVTRAGMHASLATNGTMITPAVAKELSRFNVSVQVSVDGSCAEIHEKLRGRKNSYKKTMRGVDELLKNGIDVTIGTVVTKLNVEDIPAILELAQRHEVNHFRLIPFIPCGRGSQAKELELSPGEMKEVTMNLSRQRKSLAFEIAPMEFEHTLCSPPTDKIDPSRPSECGGAIHYCTVTPIGEVLPCHYFEGVETDNVKQKSFRDIWRESRFLNYFRSMQIRDITGYCQQCDWLAACRGGCKAANFSQGALFHSNRHCWIADEFDSGKQT